MSFIGVDTETEHGRIWCVGQDDGKSRTATRDWRPLVAATQALGIIPIFHNAGWDLAEFRHEGVEWTNYEDTILKAHLLGHHPLGLKALTPIFTGVHLRAYSEVVGTGKKAVLMDSIAQEVLNYCSMYAWSTYELNRQFQLPPALQSIYEKEKKITRILMDMKVAGLPIDQDKLRYGRRTVLKRMAVLENELQAVGIDEPTKNTAIARLFWKGKPHKVTTRSKELSTAAEVLRANATAADSWVDALLEWRQLAHFQGTYLEGWKGHDVLHPSLNQTGTMTGRFSCSDPNLQNIPKSKLVSLYNLFVAPEGWTFISADYSQIELRVLANSSRDPAMMLAYMEGRDLHQETQARLGDAFVHYGITTDDGQRRFAKTINFGIAYGITAYGLAPKLNLPHEGDAQRFIDGFYNAYPRVGHWQHEQIVFGEEHGYVESLDGRPLYVPCVLAERGRLRYHGEKQCMNYTIQGGAAEIVKDAMLRAPQYLRMQIHDELLYLVPVAEADDYYHFLEETLPDTRHIVPYTVSIKAGNTWGDLKALGDIWEEDGDP